MQMANRSRNPDNGDGWHRPLQSRWTLTYFHFIVVKFNYIDGEICRKKLNEGRHGVGHVYCACSLRAFGLIWQRCGHQGKARDNNQKAAWIVLLHFLDLLGQMNRSSRSARYLCAFFCVLSVWGETIIWLCVIYWIIWGYEIPYD